MRDRSAPLQMAEPERVVAVHENSSVFCVLCHVERLLEFSPDRGQPRKLRNHPRRPALRHEAREVHNGILPLATNAKGR
jgi:hypothetical protein